MLNCYYIHQNQLNVLGDYIAIVTTSYICRWASLSPEDLWGFGGLVTWASKKYTKVHLDRAPPRRQHLWTLLVQAFSPLVKSFNPYLIHIYFEPSVSGSTIFKGTMVNGVELLVARLHSSLTFIFEQMSPCCAHVCRLLCTECREWLKKIVFFCSEFCDWKFKVWQQVNLLSPGVAS